MRRGRYLALVAALVLVLMVNLNVVYTVSVDGRELEGSFTSEQLKTAQAAANESAEEITREISTVINTAEREMRLSFSEADGDVDELRRALLGTADGVMQAWYVSVDGDRKGMCPDPTALGEVLMDMLAMRAQPTAISVQFEEEIAMVPVYTYDTKVLSVDALALDIRESTSVISVTAQGDITYG